MSNMDVDTVIDTTPENLQEFNSVCMASLVYATEQIVDSFVTYFPNRSNCGECKPTDEELRLHKIFDLKASPRTSLLEYVLRINRYLNPDYHIYVYCGIVIDRLISHNPYFKLTKVNTHTILLTA